MLVSRVFQRVSHQCELVFHTQLSHPIARWVNISPFVGNLHPCLFSTHWQRSTHRNLTGPQRDLIVWPVKVELSWKWVGTGWAWWGCLLSMWQWGGGPFLSWVLIGQYWVHRSRVPGKSVSQCWEAQKGTGHPCLSPFRCGILLLRPKTKRVQSPFLILQKLLKNPRLSKPGHKYGNRQKIICCN